MSWVRLDDGFADHPKIVVAGPFALVANIRAMCYSARYLTDGFIPESVLRSLCHDLGFLDELIAALTRVSPPFDSGVWDAAEGGYRIHDYLDYNPSRASVMAERDKKKAAGMKGGQASAQARGQAPAQAGAQAGASPTVPSVLAEVLSPPSPSPSPSPEDRKHTDPAAGAWGFKPLVGIISARRQAAGGGPYRHTMSNYQPLLEAVELFREIDPDEPDRAAACAFDAWAATKWAKEADWPVTAWLKDPGKFLKVSP